jgi:hypothetical protein
MQFLANRKVNILASPTLLASPCPVDCFLFPKLIFALTGQHLQSITEIPDLVTRVLNSTWKEAFLEGIRKVYQPASKSVNLEGVYAEKQYFLLIS